MRAPPQPTNQSGDISMTAMIDVVFLLLVFFVWTSSFDEPERDLPADVAMRRPAVSAGTTLDPAPRPDKPLVDELIIQIAIRGTTPKWSVGGQTIDQWELLRRRLTRLADIGADPPVVIDPDGDVPTSVAIATLDLARRCGLPRVFFAVEND